MFRFNNHHQGACSLCFDKVIIIRIIVETRRYGISWVVWLHISSVCDAELSLNNRLFKKLKTSKNKLCLRFRKSRHKGQGLLDW